MKRFPKGIRTGRVFLLRWHRRQFIANDNALDPDSTSLAVMYPIDNLPPPWRRLVHEYGRNIVLQMYEQYGFIDDLSEHQRVEIGTAALIEWRERRQNELANAAYSLRRGLTRERMMHALQR